MEIKNLEITAREIVSRTILAADESTGTIAKRLATVGLKSNPETNRQYRQLLFTASGIEKYVSGVILYDETIRQSTDDNIKFPEYLKKKGIVTGIKVDTGALSIPGHSVDSFTQGLDKLGERLAEYKKLGARFAKWRAVITIDTPSQPTDLSITRNAHDLALYALICQENGIVPIVEPEVLMDGSHSFEEDVEVTLSVLKNVFSLLKDYGVYLPGMILKPNMITSGTTNKDQKTIKVVAQKTLEVLAKTVPATVTGIAFLSGGQSPDIATKHLNEINQIKNTNKKKYPWRITASYGRALQGETLERWAGMKQNCFSAQKVFIDRAEKVYRASNGELL